MSAGNYFKPGEAVTYRPSAEASPEHGIVTRDDLTGRYVLVDYGNGQPLATHRHQLTHRTLESDTESDTEDRRVTLTDPSDPWATRTGYITEQSIHWGEGRNKSTTHLTRGELQSIVNQAAKLYRIRPQCDCYPGGFSPASFEGPKEDCPEHGRREDDPS